MYRNFKISQEEKRQILEQHKFAGYGKSLNEQATGINIGVKDIVKIVLPFIPIVGNIASGVIGFTEAKELYDKGNTNGAAISFLFSVIPFGGIIKLVPELSQMSEQDIKGLSKKLIGEDYNSLTDLEKAAINGINKRGNEIKSKIAAYLSTIPDIKPYLTKIRQQVSSIF